MIFYDHFSFEVFYDTFLHLNKIFLYLIIQLLLKHSFIIAMIDSASDEFLYILRVDLFDFCHGLFDEPFNNFNKYDIYWNKIRLI